MVVVARDDSGGYVMAVLPASMRLDLAALERACGRARLTLASEAELSALFPDCDQGAMPPFGGPYGMATFVDAGLRGAREIHFQPGTHRETAVLPFAEYERLAEPVMGRFTLQPRPSREAAPVAT
jgi:Ala-tRNA(Pro) deacylase